MTLSNGDICYLKDISTKQIVGVAIYDDTQVIKFNHQVFDSEYLDFLLIRCGDEGSGEDYLKDLVYPVSVFNSSEIFDYPEGIQSDRLLEDSILFEYVLSFVMDSTLIQSELSESQKTFLTMVSNFVKLISKKTMRGKGVYFINRDTFSGVSEYKYPPENLLYNADTNGIEIDL